MGQRLVVSLMEGNNILAVIYYHWSAYFASTIGECAQISKEILKAEKNGKDILTAVLDMLERTGGGIGVNQENLEEAAKRFPGREFRKDISRNDGLMYLGKDEIQKTLDMAEGTAEIDISAKFVYNDVWYSDYFEFERVDGGCMLNGEFIDINPYEMTMEECIRLYERIDQIYSKILSNNRTKKGEEK